MSFSRSPVSAIDDQYLLTELLDPQIADSASTFVKFIFPWGKEGTPLEKFKEPRKWQLEELLRIDDHVKTNKERMSIGLDPLVYRSATCSGRGVGKSSIVGWLSLWNVSCHLGSSTLVTANTEPQLRLKTWPEVGKWHAMALNSHWFEKTSLELKIAPWLETEFKKQIKLDTGYYFAKAATWDEKNPDAFAGHHNMNGTILIFDEASGIPEQIWNVSKGYFTEPVLHRYWFAFSNGRRNTGAFFECFNKSRKYWHRRHLDARTVEQTDKTELNQIVEQHGEDSDVARVEVRGLFPRQGDKQFISRELVDDAVVRELEKDSWSPLIMGVDPARFGDDSTVIRFRRGRDARSIPPIVLDKRDNMEVANECAAWICKTNPDAVCIDAGNGTGIIDRLRELKYKVHEVWFGSSSSKPEWKDKRTELWAIMREWLKGGCIDGNEDLRADLPAPEYEFVGSSDVIKLESKDKLKARGFPSPDHADALACTFAVHVAHKGLSVSRNGQRAVRVARDVDYNCTS